MNTNFENVKNRTIKEMVESLKEAADNEDLDLTGINEKNWQWFLDDLFNDGGEARCEMFVDLADEPALSDLEYAFESDDHLNFRYDCAVEAIKIIIKELDQ